jgi:hypothetical protein
MDAKLQELLEVLREHAMRLDAISEPSSTATPFYEVMSGALVWSDEKIEDVPVQVIWALRPLFAFRSSLIRGSSLEKWRPYWEACVKMFPRWIGFRPERSAATHELLHVLAKGEKRLDRCLKESSK